MRSTSRSAVIRTGVSHAGIYGASRRRPDDPGRRSRSPSHTGQPVGDEPVGDPLGPLGVVGPPSRARPGRPPATGAAPRASTSRPRPWRSDPVEAGLAAADARRADRPGRGRPAGRRQAHAARTGQPSQRGRRAVHTVAPRSSIAWFHAHALAGRHPAVGRAPGPRPVEGAPGRRASTRPTLVSSTPTAARRRTPAPPGPVYAPMPGQRQQRVEVVGEPPSVVLAPPRRGSGGG